MKKNIPLVSILIPVYNVKEYLAECLDSLIGQTLKNIEIVCVNDGSTDGSDEILKEYAKIDERIVVVNKKNGGLPSARNAGLKVARGKYVGFVDSDDFVDINMFKKMYKKAVAENADIVVCGGTPYPEEQTAQTWLKSVLSPRDIVYKRRCLTALFDERGAQPFLWRNLVRRKFIEKHNLLLDEKIILGEDVAFQFKLFSHAKCVAFMHEKFYYYRNTRTNSIMNNNTFTNYGDRILRHVFMLEDTLKTLETTQSFEQNAVKYFNWATEFIYWDFIKVSAPDRSKIATRLKNLFYKFGFYSYSKQLERDTIEHFNFIVKYSNKNFVNPIISAVVVSNGNPEYLDRLVGSLVCQNCQHIEILLYQNDTRKETIEVFNKYLNSFDNVCFRSGDWAPLNEKYNDALKTASGKYIAFLDPISYLVNEKVFNDVLRCFEDEDIDLVGYCSGKQGKLPINECQCMKYKEFVYKVDLIRKNELSFYDYSFLTGSVFFTNYVLSCKSVYGVEAFTTRLAKYKQTDICSTEAKLILHAIVYILEKAKEFNLNKLAKKATEILNSENYSRLIRGALYGFTATKEETENTNEDFGMEALELLFKANSLAVNESQNPAIVKTLSDFILKRHNFLEQF